MSARDVRYLVAGVVLIGVGQLCYWLADGAPAASQPMAQLGLGVLSGGGFLLQILGGLSIAWALVRPLLRAPDRS
ncbi:hypothetical protein [Streptomyces sp. NPDC101132]|uniref:hypothetical protein n=1 Tax=Streptomyces sp. NPDC101132 TaxID=3366110 RepID=UPI0037FF24EC